MAPGTRNMWIVDGKQGMKCVEPEASLQKILPIERCFKSSPLSEIHETMQCLQ